MKIIYIYGPPAVGKLSTAKELSKLTGYQVFHNHLSHDLVSSVIDYESHKDIFFSLIKKINLTFLSELPNSINGIIITNCFVEKKDKDYLNRLIEVFINKGYEINFVRLECQKSILLDRVESSDRMNTTKIKSKEKLSKLLFERDYFQNIKKYTTLVIDNSGLSKIETANQIAHYYDCSILED